MRISRRNLTNLGLGGLAVLFAVANITAANAHNWWSWHWHTGSTIKTWVGSFKSAQHNAALNDWDFHSDVNFPRSSSHTEMSVFAGNYGATPWVGLASIESYAFDWWHKWNWSKITHCHARYNSYYNYSNASIQGVQCQEIGHCLGLDHSNDGCMGKGYFNNLNTTVPHNWADVNARY